MSRNPKEHSGTAGGLTSFTQERERGGGGGSAEERKATGSNRGTGDEMKYRLQTQSKHWFLPQLKTLAEQIKYWGEDINKQMLKLKRAIMVKVIK